MEVQQIAPGDKQWTVFLDAMIDYIIETWPEVVETGELEFKLAYEKELIKRLEEGGRGLFLVSDSGDIVGVMNAYVNNDTLHIAEFGVTQKARRKGYGGKMKEFIVQWGISMGAKRASIEVDKDKIIANSFWSSFDDLEKDTSGCRNLYLK